MVFQKSCQAYRDFRCCEISSSHIRNGHDIKRAISVAVGPHFPGGVHHIDVHRKGAYFNAGNDLQSHSTSVSLPQQSSLCASALHMQLQLTLDAGCGFWQAYDVDKSHAVSELQQILGHSKG